MTKPINTDSIAKATGKSWERWVREIDTAGGRTMSHTELARKLYEELDGKVDNHGWWAQGITVAYEQHIGKRIPGQLANGLFEIAVSKSVPFDKATMFGKLAAWLAEHKEFDGQAPTKQRVSETPKRSNWRCDFADGSKFAATVEGAGSTKIVLSHTAVPTQKDAVKWKEYWKNLLEEYVLLGG
jgi:hypothetical protein